MPTVDQQQKTRLRLSRGSPVGGNRRPDKSDKALARKTFRADRKPLQTLTGIQVLGTGSRLADRVVSNDDLAALGCDPEWIIQRSGIEERRHAPPEVSTGDLGFEAGRRCIERSGVDPAEIDLLVMGTTTPDYIMPSTASEVQQRLDLTCPALDVNAACAGFMYALVTAMQFVKTGSSQRALVVASDTLSRLMDPADKRIYPLFGDAAGAVLLGSGDGSQGLLSYCLGSDGSGKDLLYVPSGGSREPVSLEALQAGRQFISMDGRPVFKWAVRAICDTTRDVLREVGMTVADVDLFVLHQANTRIIDAAAADLQVPSEKMVVNMQRYGNTSAASIPLVLDELQETGRLRRGTTVLLSGFGAGLTWGTGVFRW
jgi:3-oxoacyl-[acyl-carrier-protein] synthase-3